MIFIRLDVRWKNNGLPLCGQWKCVEGGPSGGRLLPGTTEAEMPGSEGAKRIIYAGET